MMEELSHSFILTVVAVNLYLGPAVTSSPS